MRKLFAIMCVCALAQAGFSSEYYVNPNIGDDGFDGKSPTIGEVDPQTSITNGPRKTLVGAIALATKAYDVVHAAEGVYDEGANTNSAFTARCLLKGGILLIADGRREHTIIKGHVCAGTEEDPSVDERGSGPNALRCVYMYGRCILKGFTLTDGRAVLSAGVERNSAAVAFDSYTTSPAYVIDCVITNCYAGRGGASYGAWSYADNCRFIRCDIVDCGGFNSMSTLGSCRLWNCRVRNSYGTSYIGRCNMWNCTVADYFYDGNAYNCVFPNLYDGGSCKLYNCRVHRWTVKASSSTWDENTHNVSDVKYTEFDADGRPLADNVECIDQGIASYYEDNFPSSYTNNFPILVSSYMRDNDFAGGARFVNGAIDIGAGEMNWTENAQAGLTATVESAGEGQETITVTQCFNSPSLCTGFTYDGEAVTFDDTGVWSKTVSGSAFARTLVPTYVTNVYYVNATSGDDTAKGYHRNCAFKTIQHAMNVVAEGGTIHCAAGTYSYKDGARYYNAVSNVVVFTQNNVTLVGDAGATQTIIEGVPGGGETAVRCVHFGSTSGGVIQGFTIKNGGSGGTEGVDNGNNYAAGTRGGKAVACIYTGNVGMSRGGASYSTTMIRCFVDATNSAKLGGEGGQEAGYYGCVMMKEVYGWSNMPVVNCTFIDSAPHGNSGNALVYNTIIYGDSKGKCNFYNSIVTGAAASTDVLDGNSHAGVGTSGYAYDAATYRPMIGSLAVDAGQNSYYEEKFLAAYKDYTDYAGGARILGSSIDIGAGEFNWQTLPATSGLTLTLTKGETETTVHIRRNYTSDKLAIGFTFNGTAVLFADLSEEQGWQTTLPNTGLATAVLTVQYAATQTDWYISPTGSDDNKGYCKYCPVKSFAVAFGKTKKNDVVHALPGVYNYDTMGKMVDTQTRVIVPESRGLVADEGPEKTVIEGYQTEDKNGMGEDAIRGVFLNSYAYLRGFTVRNSATYRTGDGDYGGAVSAVGSTDAAAFDCVFTNNLSYRGGATAFLSTFRCYFKNNTRGNGSIYFGSHHFDDFLDGDDTIYSGAKIVNCTLVGGMVWNASGFAHVYNSLVHYDYKQTAYTNTYIRLTNAATGSTLDTYSKRGETRAFSFDETTHRPCGLSTAIDAVENTYHDDLWPAAWAAFNTGKDVSGGERVVREKMDIGAGERNYWPGTFILFH